MRWFDMKKDRVVLIGSEFWERLGGAGTWDDLLAIARREGDKYRDQIDAYLLDN